MLDFLVRKNLEWNREYDKIRFRNRMIILGIGIILLLIFPKWFSIPIAGIVVLGRLLYKKATSRS